MINLKGDCMLKQGISIGLSLLLIAQFLLVPAGAEALSLLKWDFPEKQGEPQTQNDEHKTPILLALASPDTSGGTSTVENRGGGLPILFPSEDFDPILTVGMILVIATVEQTTGKIMGDPTYVKIRSEEIVPIPGIGPLGIVGKKLSAAAFEIRKFTGQNFKIGLMMGDVNTVQVLGRVQKPGNYPGDLPLSSILADAMDRAPGSNFKVHLYNGLDHKKRLIRYEDIVKGTDNPIVPPGSIVYLPASASWIFGEMTEKQINLAYLIVITLGALGITAIAKQ